MQYELIFSSALSLKYSNSLLESRFLNKQIEKKRNFNSNLNCFLLFLSLVIIYFNLSGIEKINSLHVIFICACLLVRAVIMIERGSMKLIGELAFMLNRVLFTSLIIYFKIILKNNKNILGNKYLHYYFDFSNLIYSLDIYIIVMIKIFILSDFLKELKFWVGKIILFVIIAFIFNSKCAFILKELIFYILTLPLILCIAYFTIKAKKLNFYFQESLKNQKIEHQKYISLIHSKITHEFKNPLISINEIVDQINDHTSNFGIRGVQFTNTLNSNSNNINLNGRKTTQISKFKMADIPEEINHILYTRNLSHPLTSTSNNTNIFSSYLSSNNLNSNPKKILEEFLAQIKSMCNYLLLLINDFSYLESIENNNLINPTECNLNEILNFTESIAQGLIKKLEKSENVKFSINKLNTISSVIPEKIFTDEIKLKQILVNLVSNAIKFTNRGKIILELEVDDSVSKNLIFSISDTGVGMPLNFLNKNLIKNQSQISKEISPERPESMGLTIVQSLTKLLGGEIEYFSDPGKGSKFWLTIPIQLEENLINCNDSNSMSLLNSSTETILLDEFILTNPFQCLSNDYNNFLNENVCENLNEDLQDLKQHHSNNNLNINLNEENENLTNTQIIPEIEENEPLNIIIADDEALIRSSTVRIFEQVASKLNIKINLLLAQDGMQTLFYVYKFLSQGQKLACVLSDENMVYMRGSTSASIIGEIFKEKNLTPLPFYIVTAYEDQLMLKSLNNSDVSSIYQKPLQKAVVEKILKRICEFDLNE